MRKALYILGDLDDGDLYWMSDVGNLTAHRDGEILVERGRPVSALYIVIDGQFNVELADGRSIANLAAGDIIGEMSLIEKQPPSVSVKAAGEARVLAIPQEALRARLRADTAFAARFYRALAVFLSDRVRTTVARLGYGTSERDDAQEAFETEHELDEAILDNLHVAGDRMRRLISILEGTAHGFS